MPRWLIWILIALGAFIVVNFAVGAGLFVYAIRRRKPRGSDPSERPSLGKYADRINEGIDWFKSQPLQPVEIKSYDGLRLRGNFLPAEGRARGAILLMHGYRSDAYLDFSCSFRFYHEQGLHILSVHQRAHGESEGKNICFGVKERFDCRSWARWLREKLGPDTPIVLGGLSMGCSTVLMATGLELPETVVGVVADCGFTSPYDEFRWIVTRGRFMPVWRLAVAFSSLVSRAVAGFGFKDCSTLEAMEKNRLPVLFIHGGRDTFVPTIMSVRCFAACKAEKELLIVPEASHGVSFLVDEARWTATVTAFLERVTEGYGD